jgi:hypothetical protein
MRKFFYQQQSERDFLFPTIISSSSENSTLPLKTVFSLGALPVEPLSQPYKTYFSFHFL